MSMQSNMSLSLIYDNLHDRDLMQYGDKLEDFGKSLPELLNVDTLALSSEFGIKRGHIARFTDRSSACGIQIPPTHVLRARKRSTSRSGSVNRSDLLSVNSRRMQSTRSHLRSSLSMNETHEISDMKIKDGHIFKGIVAAEPAEPRLCGCIQPPPIIDDVSPYTDIENISVQKLTPEYKIGMERLVKTKTPPMKASGLWRDKPAILLCIRRPGSCRQFIERNFGDWAPFPEITEICTRLQKSEQGQPGSIEESPEG